MANLSLVGLYWTNIVHQAINIGNDLSSL